MPTTKDRNQNLSTKESVKTAIHKIWDGVEKGFQDQVDRADDISDFWDIYNCKLSPNQLYNSGRNKLFAPFVFEAIQARATRFVNQLFPVSDRHVEAASENGTLPRAAVSMCEHYIKDTDLREVMAALFAAGDVEGQMNLYVEWVENNRRTVSRVENQIETDTGVKTGEKVIDITDEEKPNGGPRIEIISDKEVCILPATSCSVDDALASGGSVSIIRRWNKSQLESMVDAGALDKSATQEIIDNIESFKDEGNTKPDASKKAVQQIGIKKDGRGTYALVYEIWAELEVETDEKRLCQIFMVSPYIILNARRNPLWCDLCPLLSVPVKRIPGSAKGPSLVKSVQKLQYFANDVLNEMADSANYTLLPITQRDPAYATSPLILAPGAIWDVPPNSVAFAEMPPIWSAGSEILGSIKTEIFQVLSVNPSMVTQSAKRKPSQAEVAQEQQIDILTTGDSTRVAKDGILGPLVNFFMELDYQFRDFNTTVREYGEIGLQANLEKIPPLHLRRAITFAWIGDEIVKGIQQVQQKMATMNVLMKIPPNMMPHFQMDWEPILTDIIETVYGARIGRLALKDTRSLLSLDPEKENALMDMGHYVVVHPMDDAMQHIQSHEQSMQVSGDALQLKAAHVLEHKLVLQQQMQAQQPQPQGGQPGAPQGQEATQGPGARSGAAPDQARPAQQPPGSIPQDQMKDAGVPPRRT